MVDLRFCRGRSRGASRRRSARVRQPRHLLLLRRHPRDGEGPEAARRRVHPRRRGPRIRAGHLLQGARIDHDPALRAALHQGRIAQEDCRKEDEDHQEEDGRQESLQEEEPCQEEGEEAMSARVPFVCGNWKMHKTVSETVALLDALLPNIEPLAGVEVGVSPPFTSLHAASKRLVGSKIALAAQNCHGESQGAYTGEVSAPMLKEIGARYVILGHSERRTYFGETNEGCAKKIGAVLNAGMRVIYCLGETLQQREANETIRVVTEQFTVGLAGFSADRIADLVVAYEPVWA